MHYRYVHNQLVERHAKVALHSWGLCCKWPYSDVGLLRYHVKSMVTDDDESTHHVRLFSLSQAASIVA